MAASSENGVFASLDVLSKSSEHGPCDDGHETYIVCFKTWLFEAPDILELFVLMT